MTTALHPNTWSNLVQFFAVDSDVNADAICDAGHHFVFSALISMPKDAEVLSRRSMDTCVQLVCGVREGVEPVWIGKRPEMQKCPKTFVHDCSSSSFPAKQSISWAKRKLILILSPMLTVPWWSSSASVLILYRKMLKTVGESKRPFLTPAVVLNQSMPYSIKSI